MTPAPTLMRSILIGFTTLALLAFGTPGASALDAPRASTGADHAQTATVTDPCPRNLDAVQTTYVYNASGRVTSEAVSGGATTTHTYDGDGRRLTSTAGGTTTAFGWNPASYQLATESTGGSVVRRYAYGLGQLGIGRPNQTGLDYFHLDRMGSVRGVTNPTAVQQWSNEWEPYGVPRATVKVDPAAGVNPIGWTGQYGDPNGQVHLRARQYDPTLGRFMAPDQAASMSFSATGAYANANPLAYADPTGLWSMSGTWNAVAAGAAVVAPVAGVVAPFTGPLGPVVGGVAVAAGAITAIDSAYNAYQVCSGAEKGSCAGEIAIGAMGIAIGGAGAAVIKSAARGARTAARSCSFGGAIAVLMADGSHKAIEDVEVGDLVIATDPETGEQAAKRVERVFVHEDTVVDLVVDGEVITTTEDHPFWSVTDQRFERADELATGEKVLSADGDAITVSGFRLGTERGALAYNLTVEGIHTYHVGAAELLVHNVCPVNPSKYVRELEGGVTRTYKKFTPARTPGEIAGARYVSETGPRGSRSWMESYDHRGRVRIVHLKRGEYPHYMFGPTGIYIGTFL